MANPDQLTLLTTQPGDAKRRKTHGRATLADVARHAGVTAMTVSRTLREPGKVSVDTAQRVHMALQATGYAPNKSAGLLASGRSRIVAALVPNIANSIFAETIQGLSDALQADGLELLLTATGYSLEREEHQIRAVLGWAPAALIVTGRHHAPGAVQMMRRAQADGAPVIEIWDNSPGSSEFIQVGFNHTKAGRAMFMHLQQCGYTDLVYVDSGVVGDLRAHERRHGFVAASTKAAKAAKAGCRTRIVSAPQEEPMAAGRWVMQRLLEEGDLPHAVAFSNDYFAAGAILQAREQGTQIPQQLGVMGFGDMSIAAQIGISTLAVPRYGIGFTTGTRVIALIAQQADNPPAELTSTRRVPGDSVALQLVKRSSTRSIHV